MFEHRSAPETMVHDEWNIVVSFCTSRSRYLSSTRIMGKAYSLALSQRNEGFGGRLKFAVLNGRVAKRKQALGILITPSSSLHDFPLCPTISHAKRAAQVPDKFRIVMLIQFPVISSIRIITLSISKIIAHENDMRFRLRIPGCRML